MKHPWVKNNFMERPLGVFEMSNFQNGTKQIAVSIATSTKRAFSLVGGGDSISATTLGMDDKFSYISTGGGAMLESTGKSFTRD